MDNNSKVFQQPYKKPIDFYDDDLSDDEDNDVVFMPQQHPPTTRKTLPNINAINKMKGYSVPSFKTKMKPIPSLISTAGRVNNNPNNYSRGDLMLSQVPGLTPIDRSKFFSFDKFRPKQGKREAFNGTGHRIGTASSSFGSRVSGFFFYILFLAFLFIKLHAKFFPEDSLKYFLFRRIKMNRNLSFYSILFQNHFFSSHDLLLSILTSLNPPELLGS